MSISSSVKAFSSIVVVFNLHTLRLHLNKVLISKVICTFFHLHLMENIGNANKSERKYRKTVLVFNIFC